MPYLELIGVTIRSLSFIGALVGLPANTTALANKRGLTLSLVNGSNGPTPLRVGNTLRHRWDNESTNSINLYPSPNCSPVRLRQHWILCHGRRQGGGKRHAGMLTVPSWQQVPD